MIYSDLAADRQRLVDDLLREQNTLTIPSVESRYSALSDDLKQPHVYSVGGWVCARTRPPLHLYREPNVAETPRFSSRSYRLAGRSLPGLWPPPPPPSDPAPDGRPLVAKSLYLDLLNEIPGVDAPSRVSATRRQPCTNPQEARPSFLNTFPVD